MRVALVNNFFSPVGGAEESAFLIYKLLREYGHDVSFFATDKKPYFEDKPHYQNLYPSFIDYDQINSTKDKLALLPRTFHNKEAEESFRLFVNQIKPDLIHLDNFYYHLTPSILKVAQEKGIPVIQMVHDVRVVCPAGTMMINHETYCKEELCISGSALNCITNRCYDKSLVKSALVTAEFMYRQISGSKNLVSRYIAISETLKGLLVRGGIPSSKVDTILYYLDDSYLNYEPTYSEGEYFLYAGRLSKEKNIVTILKAIAQVDKNIPLRIAGSGPDRDSLEQLANDLGLTQITFLGHLTNGAIREQFQGCIASIIPSIWFEAFGRTIIETFAFGRPVIGTRLGAIQELIKHQENGLLFEPENVDELAACIRTVYEHRDYATKLGRQAREDAVRGHQPARFIQQLEECYSTVLGRPVSCV